MKSDVLIVGGGPSGSTAAMFLLREGIKPVIVEGTPFPRYHIGESMTGAGGKVLRDLGLDGEMYKRKFPTKQGVKVFGQSSRGSWFVPVTGRDENWKLYGWDTWQVRRSDFDAMMLNEAESRGATVLRGTAVKPLRKDGTITGAQVRMEDGGTQDISSEVLVDCSGQATWLANQGETTGPKYLGAYDKQIAIFSQVSGARRDPGTAKDANRDQHKDNTLIFYQKKYHWAWFIPLDEDVVSIGIVVPSAYFLEKNETLEAFYARELKEMHPELARRVEGQPIVEDIHVIPNYSYQVRGFAGKGFLCLGDAHRFIDPIFSFGVTVAMREAQIAAPSIRAYLEGAHRDEANPFAAHQLFCEQGIDVLEDVLDAFWEHPLAFAYCVHARFSEYMTDMLAGRIYPTERQPSPAMIELRQLLKREGQREASYAAGDAYSVPIGSRYHPERAALWDASSDIQSTEAWMGPR